MEKLVKRFERVIWESTPGAGYLEDLELPHVTRDCAEESKKLAIEFYNWMIVSPDFRYDIEIKGDVNDYFNLFIKEFYK